MAGRSWHVSCSSDKWSGRGDPDEDYIGFVCGTRNGESSWVKNGHRVRTGYIIFLKSNNIDTDKADTMHGCAYYKIFRENFKDVGDVKGIGFSFQPGRNPRWKGTSRTFNDVEVGHPDMSDPTLGEIIECLREWNRTDRQNFPRNCYLE